MLSELATYGVNLAAYAVTHTNPPHSIERLI
jgi:hypothetical protein